MGPCAALVGGYAIEGHVPARRAAPAARRKAKAIGLAVPAMPLGSPGMDGPGIRQPWDAHDVLLVLRGRQRGGLSILHLKETTDDDDADEEDVDGALLAAAVRRPPWRLPPEMTDGEVLRPV